jgi:hypothetical protein
MPSPTAPTPTPGNANTTRALAGTWMALANVHAQAYADWLTLCQETTARCALTRSLPEYMAVGSLMLPSCLSHAMHYCKSLAKVAQTGIPASPPPAGAQGDAARPDGKAQPGPADVTAR